ncbi:hypothetical protein KKJ09_14700 [Xenorhabdus bovienii]|uniref:hypothetical protein n=1 Tax=Xenorhabdus bovienii TaxID=40576 RepID=UPI0023B217AA|nr:hypothetical protein [Xenorhabdus bovienii]MDE9494795.1 hypothetical protein [Xenorhabdus bovienii]MDE9503144.1 hypothetical protein [Xenorhabdus bovienii]MDE9526939.1 hypothetical protein [Xenorhabdus bovienii]
MPTFYTYYEQTRIRASKLTALRTRIRQLWRHKKRLLTDFYALTCYGEADTGKFRAELLEDI